MLTWKIWWAPNNASRWQMGFNSAFKGLSITYSVFVFVAFGRQHGMRMRRIVICGLSGSTIFSPNCLTNGTIFEKKKKKSYLTKWVFWFGLQLCLKYFSLRVDFREISWIYKHRSSCKVTRYSCQRLMKFEFSLEIFEKYRNVKINKKNLFGVSGQTDRHNTTLTVDFRNFTNTPKIWINKRVSCLWGVSDNRSWKVINEVKWSEVKGIRSEEEIGYFQKTGVGKW